MYWNSNYDNLKRNLINKNSSSYRKGFLRLNFLVVHMSNLHTWGHVRHGSFITNSLQSLQALKSWPKLSPDDVMEVLSSPSTIWQTLNCWINNLITVRYPWGKLGELVRLALRCLQNRLEIESGLYKYMKYTG